jgi:hypothetical protein
MNVKIKELMKQAGTDTSGKWMGVDHAEKFAELIVKECVHLFGVTRTEMSLEKFILNQLGLIKDIENNE